MLKGNAVIDRITIQKRQTIYLNLLCFASKHHTIIALKKLGYHNSLTPITVGPLQNININIQTEIITTFRRRAGDYRWVGAKTKSKFSFNNNHRA